MRSASIPAVAVIIMTICLPWPRVAVADFPLLEDFKGISGKLDGQHGWTSIAGEVTEDPDDAKYLLLDSRIVEKTDNAKLSVGVVEKDPRNPFFTEDKPWEVRYDNLYANVIFDRDEKIYKCWYSPFIIDKATATATEQIKKQMTYRKRLGMINQREMGVCYATSKDGFVWEKPELGILDYEGSKKNNLVKRNVHGAGVFKDPHDLDPARRYKMFLERGGMSVCFSPDGLNWSKVIPCPEIKVAGDTHNNALWDERGGHYVGITRMWGDGQRIVGRTTSGDFTRWTKAVEVYRGLKRHLQTYAMPVFRYANVYLGLAMIFNTQTDLVDCELTWSPDTVHWERVCPGTSLIPRGAKGSYDWGCIYAAAYPIADGDRMRLYYGGNDGPHTDWRKGFLCLAWLRSDGFAAMEPTEPDKTALIVTRPIKCVGKQLRVSVDAAGGSLRVGVLEADGFGLEDCLGVNADVTDGVVRWKQGTDLAALQGKPIRLKFELRGAKLYAFGFGE